MSERSLIDKALKRMREEMPTYVHSPEAEEALGMAGRMLSGSKQDPEGEVVFWNACLFNERGEQIWHGDINVTREAPKLAGLACQLGPLYLTREQPFRFKGLKVGRAERPEHVMEFHPS